MDKISQRIEEEFSKLPQKHLEAIHSINWIEIVKDIGKKYNLEETEIEDVAIETGVALLGLRNYKDFSSKIEEIIVVSDLSDQITDELVENIFEKIAHKIDPEVTTLIAKEKNKSALEANPQFEQLPENVQQAISLSGWEESLFEITKNHKLNIDQSGIFEDLTIKAIKNEISSEEYHDQILTKISVDKEKALEIISSVNEKIFKKIREIMQENNDFKKDDNIFSGDKIPLPPYIQKENLNEVPEKKIITEDYPKIKTETLITKTEKEEPKATFIKEGNDTGIGGLNSVDFSIPKPIVDNIKNRTDGATSQANSSKPHDPYREII